MTRIVWARAFRGILVFILLAVLSVIVLYFVTHRRRPAVRPPGVSMIPAQKVEKQEGVEHVDFRGERVIRAKADRHYAGDDGRYYLEGHVEVHDLAKKGGREISFSGNKVAYDKDWNEASLEGNAKVKYGDLAFESLAFAYRKASDILTTEKGVVFSTPKLSGKALRMTYYFKDEIIRLEGEVSMQAKDESESPSPFNTSGAIFTYYRLERKGSGEGQVNFSLGKSQGKADMIDFQMTDDEQFLRQMTLKGAVCFNLVEEKNPSPEIENPLLDRSRRIEGDELAVRTFLNMNKIHSVDARGGCRLNSFASAGRRLETSSKEMRLVFDRWGGLREFWAVDKANMIERGADSKIERLIAGQDIFIEGQGEMLRVRAPEGGEALVDSADSEITGQEIKLDPRSDDIYAWGNLRVILKVQPDNTESVGFFSREQPVLISSQEMSYQQESHRLVLYEGARLWQGKQMILAKGLTVERETGAIQGSGGVRAVLSRAPKKETGMEERLEVGGERMSFSPKERLLNFEKDSWLITQSVRLKSERIAVQLKEKKGEIQTIEAKGKVSLTSGPREGKGGAALYNLDLETIVLTDNPSLIDKEKGVVEGDKLTFHLGDGRILVENKDRERSVTVIKS
jgi:lipopolysaccharide export system protein LptA